MVKIRAFRAVRPKNEYAKEVAALPYDVFSVAEAREEIRRHPKSFLQVDLPEATVEGEVEGSVNKIGKQHFDRMQEEGLFYREEAPCLYVYELERDGYRQRGLMCLASVDDYLDDKIKKHEKTRREKEENRVDHIDTLDAQTGPIFLTYRNQKAIDALIDEAMKKEPLAFTTDDDTTHRLWTIDDGSVIGEIVENFKSLDALYIADGHHRSASAVRVGEMRRKAYGPGNDETPYNYFMAIVYPAEELKVYDYNRVVADLNGLTLEEFLEKIGDNFSVEEEKAEVHPREKGEFGMFVDGKWYRLRYKGEAIDDVIEGLDVSILQNFLLAPVLGIGDPRSDKRIDFVGGVRGLKELERRVKEDMTVAFSMFPTSLDDLMVVADAGKVMPPKSTWFEPKPRSGLFIHPLETK
ncbi:hypothetical protein HMPREF1863_01158 [Aedoeadaptatus coxii]|uniref:DUF1015 domain-containing protein n=1 Tax=Aedoeadaptatus coxii TaxID=755172 RepID=A0A134ADZ1_9FIRM|nr:DUF1015 family protein [Peptoniphilus coxii]KXB65947.1 hypothetical protein HMPREF1863_01158 [Peptoniphilus coxii]